LGLIDFKDSRGIKMVCVQCGKEKKNQKYYGCFCDACYEASQINTSIPVCCQNCEYFAVDCYGDFATPYVLCQIGVALPTKKKSCKRQSKVKKEKNHDS